MRSFYFGLFALNSKFFRLANDSTCNRFSVACRSLLASCCCCSSNAFLDTGGANVGGTGKLNKWHWFLSLVYMKSTRSTSAALCLWAVLSINDGVFMQSSPPNSQTYPINKFVKNDIEKNCKKELFPRVICPKKKKIYFPNNYLPKKYIRLVVQEKHFKWHSCTNNKQRYLFLLSTSKSLLKGAKKYLSFHY